MYELKTRIYTEDFWRSTTYQRRDGSTFHVSLPPIEIRADYGNGKVFLDHRSYNERAEHEMALRLYERSGA